MQLNQALEIFMHGEIGIPSAENRSSRQQLAGLDILHSDDVWNQQRQIADEAIVQSHAPAEVLALLADYQPSVDHRITLVDRPTSEHAAYHAAGYRHSASEVLLARSLNNLPAPDPRYAVAQATTIADMEWLNTHDPAKRAWLTVTRLLEPRLRHSFIRLDAEVVARVRVCQVDPAHSYVTNLYTAPNYRRRGIAQALMIAVLQQAAALGECWSVLIASEAGLPLYQKLGYQPLATLTVFEPAEASE
ncbi:GNAT family N-acetyltransferase [Herpetosiphon giganteus]|uniref:GNAT family N-acetyltransferase n=1 Tax=Herpetosiphon giganteus TaxID=2029754 RepID=UPI0019597D08|nr:GNAT family N-acetyltransferase [Herpetosiphon giganteus]MBM7844383.1 GNAT superfamily N-acetyltransferase [Herpetosiphon giganteus]